MEEPIISITKGVKQIAAIDTRWKWILGLVILAIILIIIVKE